MKSTTSPTPASVKNRVTRTAESGKYICDVVYSVPAGRMRKCPPRSSSSNAPNTLGESNRGQQNQSTEPSVVTRAAVCRSPISPCSEMVVSRLLPVVSVVAVALMVSPLPEVDTSLGGGHGFGFTPEVRGGAPRGCPTPFGGALAPGRGTPAATGADVPSPPAGEGRRRPPGVPVGQGRAQGQPELGVAGKRLRPVAR